MKKTLTTVCHNVFPAFFKEFVAGYQIYDSSSSQDAQVWWLDREEGFFIKSAAKGALEAEAAMAEYFYRLGLGAQVLAFHQEDRDWLLTQQLPGEDCVSQLYLDDPKRLCDTTAVLLRQLHEITPTGCSINRKEAYIQTARDHARLGRYDTSLFPDNWGYASAAEARMVMEEAAACLACDTLIHGDYCLPNIILKNWALSGFIDLGSAGLGDRHMDLHWGIWSLGFNLKTDQYRERFLDAYGRDQINPELLDAIGAFEVFMG